jgi:hypothetical protein
VLWLDLLTAQRTGFPVNCKKLQHIPVVIHSLMALIGQVRVRPSLLGYIGGVGMAWVEGFVSLEEEDSQG